MTLIGLLAESTNGSTINTLLYPRLKTQASPQVVSIAEGAGAKITTEAGTDYVFLSNAQTKFKEGDIEFSGTSGLIQIRGNNVTLSLGEPGIVSAKGKVLKR
jgi:hypothetical protein